MPETLMGRQFGWNPAENAWQEIKIYWEDGFVHDHEWIDDHCFIMRIDQSLWIETSLYDQGRDGELTLRSRTRTRQQSYVLAQKYCRDTAYGAWVEPSDLQPITETWNVEGEFWATEG